jgi:hypothetical protein
MHKQRVDIYKSLGGYGTLGLEIVLSVLLGLFGGRWLDERYGTDPWLSLLGLFFGSGAAVRAVQRTQRALRRVAEREEREQGNPRPSFDSPKDRLAQLEERKLKLERMLIERTMAESEDDEAAPGSPADRDGDSQRPRKDA